MKMKGVKETLRTDKESFCEVFCEENGIYELQSCLRNPSQSVKGSVLECVPFLFTFESARHFIKGKLDFFTTLYGFLDSSNLKEMRNKAAYMFTLIMTFMSRGSLGFNLITKAAENYARKNGKACYDEIVSALELKDPELRLNVLNLINLIIMRSPSDKKKS